MGKIIMTIAAVAAFGILAAAPDVSAQSRVQVGLLKCDVGAGVGMIVTSKRELACQFESDSGSSMESYDGSINRVGIDIGRTQAGRMVWAVFATNFGDAEGQLTGSYSGVSAGATIGVGLGANLLVGGFNKSIMLQPLSLHTQQGLKAAMGIAKMDLQLQ